MTEYLALCLLWSLLGLVSGLDAVTLADYLYALSRKKER